MNGPRTEAGTVFDCRDVEHSVDAYLDGEFAREDAAEFERHLSLCAHCTGAVRAQSEFRSAFRAAVARPPLPNELRSRLKGSLAFAPGPETRWQRFAWRIAPAAAAAAVGLFVWQSRSFTPMVAEAIAKHQRNLPIEISGGEPEVRAWFANKVDFAVRPPHLPKNSILRGARLANMRERQAAYLVYDVNGEKVSVLVFDPKDLSLDEPFQGALPTRHHRQVKNHDVYLDGERGYNVAVYRDRDLGYTVTSGMDEDQMIQLVSSAVSP